MATLSLASGCATAPPGSSRYLPAIPPRPSLAVQPEYRPCRTEDGRQGRCVELWAPDLEAITRWAAGLERELRAACLALGGTAGQCGTE